MPMEPLEQLQALYQSYEAQFHAAERARKPTQGAFGFGEGPGDHPCHRQFADELASFLQATAAGGLPPEQARQMLEFIYFAPASRVGEPAVYWMMVAVHSHTLPLIPALEPEAARALSGRYQEVYPRRTLLPAQRRAFDALKKRGKV